jgi:hypothetical protein
MWDATMSPSIKRRPFRSAKPFANVVKVERGSKTVDRDVTCPSCVAPLPGREGTFILKYFMLRKAGRKKGWRRRNLRNQTSAHRFTCMNDQPARFPPSWIIEEYRGISYIDRDANRFAEAYAYFASEPGHTRYLMTRDEARIIAATIADVPELVKRE